MEESEIKKLFHEIGGSETVETTKEYSRLLTKESEIMDALEAVLPQGADDLLQELDDVTADMEKEIGESHFVAGFKRGYLLAMEILK